MESEWTMSTVMLVMMTTTMILLIMINNDDHDQDDNDDSDVDGNDSDADADRVEQHVHFWLGEQASTDEAAIAAYKVTITILLLNKVTISMKMAKNKTLIMR